MSDQSVEGKIKNPKKKISTGLTVGLIAIAINIITAGVYIYQTSIMQSQQYASVWPYVEWKTGYTQDKGFVLRVKNNGIGPALLKQKTMTLNGEAITNLDTLFTRLLGTRYFPHIKGVIQNRVLPSGDSLRLIVSTDKEWAEKLYMGFIKNNFEMEICYESIYKEQWTSKGIEVIEGECN